MKASGDRDAVFVQRAGKVLKWTWNQYYRESMAFAKAMQHLNVTERSSVAIMGFNSPEWIFGFLGGIMYNCVVTGIYTTNAADACFYQADHSEAEIVLLESADMVKRFDLSKLTKVKAVVIWGESALPKGAEDKKYFLWKDFMKLGASVKDEVILEKSMK